MEKALIAFAQAVAADPGVSPDTRDNAQLLEVAAQEQLQEFQDTADASTGAHNDF
ncbi:hypothetical protein [Prescottella equi]|uniref:hypothetical protein n=1 Tax=Rhodococcus hoagii TaxID=43767 RepID=UPI003B763906